MFAFVLAFSSGLLELIFAVGDLRDTLATAGTEIIKTTLFGLSEIMMPPIITLVISGLAILAHLISKNMVQGFITKINHVARGPY